MGRACVGGLVWSFMLACLVACLLGQKRWVLGGLEDRGARKGRGRAEWSNGSVVWLFLAFILLQYRVGLVASSIFWRLARHFAFLSRVVGAWWGGLVVDDQVPGAEASERQHVRVGWISCSEVFGCDLRWAFWRRRIGEADFDGTPSITLFAWLRRGLDHSTLTERTRLSGFLPVSHQLTVTPREKQHTENNLPFAFHIGCVSIQETFTGRKTRQKQQGASRENGEQWSRVSGWAKGSTSGEVISQHRRSESGHFSTPFYGPHLRGGVGRFFSFSKGGRAGGGGRS